MYKENTNINKLIILYVTEERCEKYMMAEVRGVKSGYGKTSTIPDKKVSTGYDLIIEPMSLDEFIKVIKSTYQEADYLFEDVTIAIDTDLNNTYYINKTDSGFECDLFDGVFDDLDTIANQLYEKMHGNATYIRYDI